MAKEKKEPVSKEESLQLAIDAISKTYGKGTIIFGEPDAVPGIEFFSSGSAGVDDALGGGWAKGRIIEISGLESSGKTTLCLHAIAELQSKGELTAFIDVEHAFDPAYATQIGVDMEKLIFSQPDSAEQALNIADTLIRSGAIALLVIDSVAALVPQKELEGDMGDSVMGLQARLMSQAMRKLCGIAEKTNTTIIWVNQIRMKIGIVYGNPEVTTGGNALKFYASQRVDVRRIGAEKEGDELVANKTRVKVVKNKVAPPFREYEFLIRYGIGIDKYADLIQTALSKGILERTGAWYKMDGENIGQGMQGVVKFLHENPDKEQEIKDRLNGN